MKTGLVLEGGAMRGLFTAGVMDVLMENGVVFDGIIGVSAGAAFGCNYKSGQEGRVLRYNTRYCRDSRYCGVRTLLRTGNIYSAEFCYGEVPLKLDPFDFAAYKNDPSEFYVVCTDVETGIPVYHKYTGTETSGFDWIRASASMPLVSRIVGMDGLKLLDGGITDSIPLEYFESIGYDRCVVVLTQPRGFRKQPNAMIPVIKRRYRKYPKLVEAMANRHVMYNAELDYVARAEREGRALVIRPAAALPVSRIERDPKNLERAYIFGRRAARQQLSELKSFLEEAKRK